MTDLDREELVQRATHDLAALLPVPSSASSYFSIRAAPFTPQEKAIIFAIFEANMKELYVPSSFGWHPAEKKKELFHPLSRFIVAKPSERSKTVQGYLMWRADIEEDIKGNDEVVLYMYELSVSKESQGLGLGCALVTALESIGKSIDIRKVMLTVLKDNAQAIRFYKRNGFEIDATSPSRCLKEEEQANIDYDILSKTF